MATTSVNERMEWIISGSHEDRSGLGKSRAFRSSMCGGGVVEGLCEVRERIQGMEQASILELSLVFHL